MSIIETLFAKLPLLSPDDQRQVLAFVRDLERKKPNQAPIKDPKGMFADRGVHITLEDIAEARREMWSNFPRDFPEPSGS